jgi:hypothetical protein
MPHVLRRTPTVWLVIPVLLVLAMVGLFAARADTVSAQQPGAIQVTKQVNWNNVTPYAVTFQVCISGPVNQCQNLNVVPNQAMPSVNFVDLPEGVYTLSETNPAGLWQASFNPGIQIEVDNDQHQVTVTNTHVAPGSLRVTKAVNWNNVTPDPTKTFQICVSSPQFSQSCATTTAGGQLIWMGLPPGTYTISETHPGANWGAPVISPNPVTVSSNVQSNATVTNTRLPGGQIQVSKVVNWGGMAPDPSAVFQVCIQSSLYSECRNVSPGHTAHFAGLPSGLYTISEVSPGPGWGTPVISPEQVFVQDQQISTASVTNFAGGTGRIDVQKLVRWHGVTPVPVLFEICISGTHRQECKTLSGAGTVSFTNLPAGSYTVTETHPGAGWDTPIISDSFITLQAGQVGGVTIINDRIPATPTPTATPTMQPPTPMPPTLTPTPTTAPATPTPTLAPPGPPHTGTGLGPSPVDNTAMWVFVAVALLSLSVAATAMARRSARRQ